MKFRVNLSTIWEFGDRKDAEGRPHQEDSLYPCTPQVATEDRLFLICDGMGGHAAGEVASATVVEAFLKAIDPASADRFSTSAFEKGLSSAYDALDKLECADSRKPGTTLALLKLHSEGALVAHIGDSRVYHIRPGETAADTRILFQTSDHSLVTELVKLGELTEEEARTSSQRNVITRAMQPGLSPRPGADLKSITDIRKGDYFYLCSDGMLEVMDDATMREIFSHQGGNLTDKTARLVKETAANHDNHTAIIVEIAEVESAPAGRMNTSMLNDEMSARARAVEERMSREQSMVAEPVTDDHPAKAVPAKERKKQSLLAWCLVAAVVIIAALLIYMFMGREGGNPEVLTVEETVTVVAEQPEQAPASTEADEAEAAPVAAKPATVATQLEPAAPKPDAAPAPIAPNKGNRLSEPVLDNSNVDKKGTPATGGADKKPEPQVPASVPQQEQTTLNN